MGESKRQSVHILKSWDSGRSYLFSPAANIQALKQLQGEVVDLGSRLAKGDYRIITERHDSSIRHVLRKKVTKPDWTGRMLPSGKSMTAKTMNSNNANGKLDTS